VFLSLVVTAVSMFLLDGCICGDVAVVEPDGVVGMGWLEGAELDPTGVFLATCSDWAIRVWSLDGECVSAIPAGVAGGEPWVSLEWSPGGGMLAGLDYRGRIYVYRPGGSLEGTGSGGSGGSGSLEGFVEVFHTEYEQESYAVAMRRRLGPMPLVWSPDGSLLAYGWLAGNVEVFNLSTGSRVATLETGGIARVVGLAWSPDSKLIAAGLAEEVYHRSVGVWVYNLTQGESVYRLPTEEVSWSSSSIHTVSFSSNGVLAVSINNSMVGLYGGDGGWLGGSDVGEGVTGLAWSPGGGYLAVGLHGGGLMVLDRGLDPVALSRTGHRDPVVSVSWQGSRIATTSIGQEVGIWIPDLQVGVIRCARVLSGWASALEEVRWYPGEDRILAVRNPDPALPSESSFFYSFGVDGGEVFEVTVPGEWIRAADLSIDGSMVATVTSRRDVVVWDAGSGSPVTRIVTVNASGSNESRALGCRWNPARPRVLAVATYEGVQVWDVTSTAELLVTIPSQRVLAVDWAGDGVLLAVAKYSTVEVWDTSRPTLLDSAETWREVTCVAFSPDGSSLACTSIYRPEVDGDTPPPPECREWKSMGRVTVWGLYRSDRGLETTLYVKGETYLPRALSWRTRNLAWSPNSTLLAIATGTPDRPWPGGEWCTPHRPGVLVVRPGEGTATPVLELTGPSRATSSVDWSTRGEDSRRIT
jgi:WD40 repeat protein